MDFTRSLIKDLLTGKDGESYDIARVLLLVFAVAYLIFTALDLYLNKRFDAQTFGLNCGGLIGMGGAGIGMKAKTEPEA